jgi:signal transduction histidine kinase
MPSQSPSAQPSSTEATRLRQELVAQGRLLDGLVASLHAVASGLDSTGVLERATQEAHRLFAPDATVMLVPAAGERTLRPLTAAGIAVGPLADAEVSLDAASSPIALAAREHSPSAAEIGDPSVDGLCAQLRPSHLVAAPLDVGGRLHGVIVLLDLGSGTTLDPALLGRLDVFAGFAAQAAEKAALFDRVEALLAQARIREAERGELSRRVVSAEQEERRRLSAFLHDGPVQTLSGIAMMLDAVEEEINASSPEQALAILSTARERQRDVVRSIRELSFVLEPWTLRDQGFTTAAQAMADQFEQAHRVKVDLDVAAAETLEVDDQVYLFGIVREAMQNALKHAACSSIRVTVQGSPDDGLEVRIADDGSGVLREPDDGLPHYGMASMRERAAILGGGLDVDAVPGEGTTVRVLVGAGKLRGGG